MNGGVGLIGRSHGQFAAGPGSGFGRCRTCKN